MDQIDEGIKDFLRLSEASNKDDDLSSEQVDDLHEEKWSGMMKRMLLICLMIICMSNSGIGAATAVENSPTVPPHDDLWTVMVLLHDGSDEAELKNILLIVVNQSTGKAMKVTMDPVLFQLEYFNPKQSDSFTDSLQDIAEQLQLSLALDKYVVLGLDILDSLDPGEAKEKGPLDLLQLGLSLLNSVETNLSVRQTISIFQLAFAQKDDSIEISLPGKAKIQSTSPDDVDWDKVREMLNRAIDDLQS